MANAPSQAQIYFNQLAGLVVRPMLARLPFGDGPIALNLLLGTAAQESGGRYLAQYPTGPALGILEIEPPTHQDLLTNYLAFRPDLAAALASFVAPQPPRDMQLASNLAYAFAVARMLYHRAPEPLPTSSDPTVLGAYYKAHYNTAGGAATVDEFVRNFALYIGDPLNA